MTDVTITTPAHQLRSYLARPAGEGPWPGVIVIHDAAGMSNDLRHQADWLASAGYLTVAPDLYSWGRKIPCIWATLRELSAGRGKDWSQRGAADRLERVLDALRVDHDVKEYPDAGHSFLNDHHNVLFKVLGLISIAYHEPSALDARKRILSFFERHLQMVT